MEKLKVMVDSCVFFRMLRFNDFASEYGAENLPAYLEMDKKSVEQKRQDIKNLLGETFFSDKNVANLPFDKQIDKYKEYYNNLLANLKTSIDTYELHSQGLISDKNSPTGVKKVDFFTPEKLAREKEKLDEMMARASSLPEYNDDLAEQLNAYKLRRDAYEDGLLYQMAVDGKIELYTNFYSFEEIINHTNTNNNLKLHVTKESVDRLAKGFFTNVTTKSDAVFKFIDETSKAYRTENQLKNDKAMGEDINSVGKYGDSSQPQIAAGLGMIFLTQNDKDFIFNKNNGKNNEEIRNHINYVNEQFGIDNGASVYSTREFLDGKYKVPSGKTFFKATVKDSSDFVSEVELGM